MADLFQFLAILDSDPDDAQVLSALADTAHRGLDPGGAAALGQAKKTFRDRGRFDGALRLLDVDLLDDIAAARCYEEALGVRPGDETATEALEQIRVARDNWQKFAAKFIDEAKASTDRSLTTQLYLAAAKTWARREPGTPEV